MDKVALKERTKRFALRVLRLSGVLARSGGMEKRVIAAQLVRCGTSVGANYRAACKARSKAEFAAKIGIVEEEADECSFWMELLVESELLPHSRLAPLLKECGELVAIMASSRMSVRVRSDSR